MAGGKNKPKEARGPEMAPRMRQLFANALGVIDLKWRDRGGLETWLAAEIEKEPVKMIQALAKFVPQEKTVTGQVDNTLQITVERVQQDGAAGVIEGEIEGLVQLEDKPS